MEIDPKYLPYIIQEELYLLKEGRSFQEPESKNLQHNLKTIMALNQNDSVLAIYAGYNMFEGKERDEWMAQFILAYVEIHGKMQLAKNLLEYLKEKRRLK